MEGQQRSWLTLRAQSCAQPLPAWLNLGPRRGLPVGPHGLAQPGLTLARLPDLLGRPAPGPFQGHDLWMLRDGLLVGPNFDHVLDFESVRPQEPDPVAVSQGGWLIRKASRSSHRPEGRRRRSSPDETACP